MLKQIPLSDLELGMFVHKMQGNWFDHPFWKSKFLIDEEDKLRTLKASQIEGVVIDTTKGRDVSPKTVECEAANDRAAPTSAGRINKIKSRRSIDRPADKPTSTQQEVHAAQAIAARGVERLHKTFIAGRLGKALNVRAVEPVVSDILASVRRNPQAFGGLMRCKLKNELVYRHALAVSALMVSLARRMKLSEAEAYEAGQAGLLLDIGTNYLPQNVDPPGGDYRNLGAKIWQQHVTLGHRALENDDGLPAAVLDACLQHHERLDGGGFPNGLAGDEISRIARMAAICDTFDFLLTSTDAADALDPAMAVQRLKAMDGAFDPDILRAFIESVGLYPVGSFVQLRSDKLAMVIDEDPKDAAKPIVQAFYSLERRERIVPHTIALARCGGEDEIVAIANLAGHDLPDEAQLRELVFLSAHKLAA